MTYEPVIGLEVHVQLNTASKIFCTCSTTFGADPNSQTCPVCLGLPGALPVLNRLVLEKGIIAGMAVHAAIAPSSKFDRKNYFYPDLPKAYQISQYDRPICLGGYIDIPVDGGGNKRIGITRLHLEEDAGKSIHPDDDRKTVSFVDLNRTGVPLVEIVSEPDMRSGEEAYRYLQTLKSIMRYIDVSDVNMEEGSLRCDVNISVRPRGATALGCKVEIKNLNSFKAVRASIIFEIQRQVGLVESGDGDAIIQETRLWNADRGETYSMRSKEYAHDYRYFPDPDLPPITISEEMLTRLKMQIPELPDARRERFMNEFELSFYDADVLTSSRQLADYFEESIRGGASPKRAANWILTELLARISDQDAIGTCTVKPAMLAELLQLIENNTISGKIAKQVFETMISTGSGAAEIVRKEGLLQVSDPGAIAAIVDRVLEVNAKSADDYRNGKENAFKYLVGQVMKESRGKANPQMVNDLLIKKLS